MDDIGEPAILQAFVRHEKLSWLDLHSVLTFDQGTSRATGLRETI
jgi:hypothetical protein